MRPYNEYRQFTPIQKGVPTVMQHCLITTSRRTGECHELRTWKQSPLDSDHVLILNASLTDKGVYFKGLHTQLFAKWGFVLVYPTSLIWHKSKYSIIFPYLRCIWMQNYYYYVNYRFCTSVVFQQWHRGGCADLWFTVFYFDKVPTAQKKHCAFVK